MILKQSHCYRCRLKAIVETAARGTVKIRFEPRDWREACAISGKEGLCDPVECRFLKASAEDQARPEWEQKGARETLREHGYRRPRRTPWGPRAGRSA